MWSGGDANAPGRLGVWMPGEHIIPSELVARKGLSRSRHGLLQSLIFNFALDMEANITLGGHLSRHHAKQLPLIYGQ